MNRLAWMMCMLSIASLAKSDDAPPDETNTTIDEITVMGVRELGQLRAELVRAEDDVYATYNELNDDDDYDIICKLQAPIGSQIKRRVCQARLYRDALAAEVEDEDGSILFITPKLNAKKHNQILREKMRKVASENPQLVVALRKRLALQQRFDRERDKRFSDDDG